MWYLFRFKTKADYDAYKQNSNWMRPNLSAIEESKLAKFNKVISLGDVAYWNGGSVYTVAKDKWSSLLGTPIGVVVIPSGMLPDGKARMIGLKPVDNNGNASSSHVQMAWGPNGTNTSLTDYNHLPITDNIGLTSTGSDYTGRLPSDKFTGSQSFVDSKSKYNGTSKLIPSPYLGDDKTLNPEYSKEIDKGNMFGDFNGLQNTEVLVGLGSDYVAASAAWKYSDGVSDTQWYLPAMGELGFILPRFNVINDAITAVGGIMPNFGIWSSSEASGGYANRLNPNTGAASNYNTRTNGCVRPFAML
jgi:hypothetical protein